MFRASLAANSAHYSMLTTLMNGVGNQYRGCNSCSSTHYGVEAPVSLWLRVSKVGNVLNAFYKYNEEGASWQALGAQLSMNSISSSGYYVGIAVTSHDNSNYATAQVSNIQLTRQCSLETITTLQCDQASNCESGQATGICYPMGEVPQWEETDVVPNIFDAGSEVTTFGCVDGDSANYAMDGTTTKYLCERGHMVNETTGMIISPAHLRMSRAEGLRVYAPDNCPYCDPVKYKIEGRETPLNNWVQISQGNLDWISVTNVTEMTRNEVQGLDIASTYLNGDNSFAFTEVSFYEAFHNYATCGSSLRKQGDYRGSISKSESGRSCQSWSAQGPHSNTFTPENYPDAGLGNHNYCRNPDGKQRAWCHTTDPQLNWEFCDVPYCVNNPDVLDEYLEYKLTWTEMRKLGQPRWQVAEIEVPGMLGEEPPMPRLEHTGEYVASIVQGANDIYPINGVVSGSADDATDGTTSKFYMTRDSETDILGTTHVTRCLSQFQPCLTYISYANVYHSLYPFQA